MLKLVRTVTILFIFLQFGVTVYGEEASDIDNRQIIVQFNSEEPLDSLEWDLTQIETSSILQKHHIYVFEVPSYIDYDKVVRSLKQDKDVLSVERNDVRTIEYNPLSNEPYYGQQWYLDAIKLPEVLNEWNDTYPPVKVAVLDSGINSNHPELKGRILPGYDFLEDDSLPNDDHGHGTFVAGIIAANINGNGIAGISDHVDIFPVKIADHKGDILSSHFIEGLYYAIENEVDIVNMSFAGFSKNKLEEQAINEAYRAGIVLVAAAGNEGTNQPMYPASYSKVISVGATDKLDSNQMLAKAEFSNSGATLDLVAPGTGIVSLGKNGGYIRGDGTSFAAPMVSGLAAFMKSGHPTWSNNTIKWAVEKGALLGDFSPGYWTENLGYGVIDMEQSMRLLPPDMSEDVSNDRLTSLQIDTQLPIHEELQLPFDEDWYQWELEEDRNVIISLENNDPGIQLLGEIYKDKDKQALHRITANESLEVQLKKGIYQIKLYEQSGRWSEVPYQLNLDDAKSIIQFVDIHEQNSHYEAVYSLVNRGAINGYPLSNGMRAFKPSESISREHVAKILTHALDLPIPENISAVLTNFSDIDENHPYANEIAATYEAGVFRGNNGRFVEGPIRREQMATVLVRLFSLSDTNEKVDIELDSVSESHRNNVKILKQHEITTETDFRPYESVTRAQFASFVYRAMDLSDL